MEKSMRFKKSLFSIALLLAFALTGAGQNKQAAQTEMPKLVIDSFTHDFGEVKAGTPLNYSFIIKNQGKANLEIKNVAPG
jgi:hypothetical protein